MRQIYALPLVMTGASLMLGRLRSSGTNGMNPNLNRELISASSCNVRSSHIFGLKSLS